jgi:hypothetical protein
MQRTSTVMDIYAYPDHSWSAMNLSGFAVEATDGEIGAVDEKVLIPAGLISRIDELDRRIFLTCTKERVENAPEFDESRWHDQAYRDELGTYYANRPGGPDYGATDTTIR